MDCVHRPQNAQSATVVLVAELVATRREERPLWICAPMIHSTAIALSPSPTERALVQVAPHPKCPRPRRPRLEKEKKAPAEIFESENGGLALHQANGLGRKRNLRHNTSHKRNLRHNTSHTQAEDLVIEEIGRHCREPLAEPALTDAVKASAPWVMVAVSPHQV